MNGDTIEVPAGGRLKLRMADGSRISLASGSHMTLASDDIHRQTKLHLKRGLIRAVVAPAVAPAALTISTPVGSAALRFAEHPADCLMEAQADSVQVGMVTGKVELTSAATGASVSFPEGWGTRLEAGRDPVPPRKWAPEEFDAFIGRTE